MPPKPSTRLRNPVPDQTEAGRKVYIALLERRLMYYSLRDIKMRSALELATGVPYDSIDFSSLTFEDIAQMIAEDMARGLNISLSEARSRVAQYQETSNPKVDIESFQV
ncbi:MAG TPA: hypothetical protein PK852_02500 [Mesotoga prima]|uniref:hypothetical protein n=1 Tax=Mesotoga prima TaxID=1184387 RepID=UPI002C045E57|nr:hypothetical protein [Mesotoga prima]HPE52965.1 hypothetical protein [Mesotoga prima]